MVSVVSVHGHLAPLLWVCCKALPSWWKCTVEEAAQVMADGKQRNRRGQGPNIFFKGTSPVI
jgi:hypothetical protein